jgi:4-hydroxy-tetrahydrodipicolinate synthase
MGVADQHRIEGAPVSQPAAALIPALPVPFTEDGGLDVPGLGTLLRATRDSGVDGVFTPGTTGEFIALEDDERMTVVAEALAVFGPEQTFAHVGAASARQAERLAARAVELGAVNLAAITPYYLPAGGRALVDYFRRVSEAAPGARIYCYLFRARTTTVVTPEQLAELAAIPGVVGAKISGEPTATVVEYLAAVPPGFAVFTGNNHEFGEVVRAGGAGCVSAVSSVFPEPFVALAAALRVGDEEAAAAAEIRIKQAIAAVGGSIALLKAGLAMRGLPAGPTRVAIDPPTSERLATLRAAIEDRP